jgi:GNAT superfamily N-acetyltransferase
MEIKCFLGAQMLPCMDDIYNLSIKAFRDSVYSYAGNLEYEKTYRKPYTMDPRGSLVIAQLHHKIVGALMGIPLKSDFDITREIAKEFVKNKIDIEDIYYYGDIMVLPSCRHHGIASALQKFHDSLILKWGFKKSCLLTIVSKEKNQDYDGLNKMLHHFGYIKTNMSVYYEWPSLCRNGQTKTKEHKLVIWINELL